MNKKKIICSIVGIVLVILIGIVIGIVMLNGNNNNKDYISRGEFYKIFIENTNMYDDTYTENNVEDYDKAEYRLYDRYLLDDEQLGKANKKVTREIVAQICVRYMEFRESSDEVISDIKKVHDQQAIIDAVGMGIFELENGKFNPDQYMTIDEVQRAIEKTLDIEMNGHYEENDYDYEFNDNVEILDDVEINNFITE